MHRLLSIVSGGAAVEEVAWIESTGPERLAWVLPSLDENGSLPDSAGVWSYGASAAGAGRIGLAGRLVRPGDGTTGEILGNPAIEATLSPEDTLSLIWSAGGEIHGDSTAAAWIRRFEDQSKKISCGPAPER